MNNDNFNWKDYFNLAKFLMENCDEESSFRTAISRFYYAAFCYTRDYLVDNHIFRDKKSKDILLGTDSVVHSEVQEILFDKFAKRKICNSDKIARELKRLRLERNDADYNKNKSIGINNAKFCLTRVKIIFDNLDKF